MATKDKGLPVTGTVTAGTRQAIEDYRWENRLTVSEVVRDAFAVWAEARGVMITEPEAPAAEAEAPAAEAETQDAPKTTRKR